MKARMPFVSRRKFETEKDAKNKAYHFILANGLLETFAEFCKTRHSDDPHRDCLNLLFFSGKLP